MQDFLSFIYVLVVLTICDKSWARLHQIDLYSAYILPFLQAIWGQNNCFRFYSLKKSNGPGFCCTNCQLQTLCPRWCLEEQKCREKWLKVINKLRFLCFKWNSNSMSSSIIWKFYRFVFCRLRRPFFIWCMQRNKREQRVRQPNGPQVLSIYM